MYVANFRNVGETEQNFVPLQSNISYHWMKYLGVVEHDVGIIPNVTTAVCKM
jgi:hypothetical protein